MAFTFNSTPKSATANSYVSLELANDISFGHSKKALWNALTDEEKQQWLVAATDKLDQEQYEGRPTDNGQALQWPRSWVTNRNFVQNYEVEPTFSSGQYYIDSDTIPRELARATFEQAVFLIDEDQENPTASRQDMDRLDTFSVGPLSYKFNKRPEGSLSDLVKRWLQAIGPNAWLGANANIKLMR